MREPLSLALPETGLAGERLWASSALSVLRARHAVYLAAEDAASAHVACHYMLAMLAIGNLYAVLCQEEERLHG